MKRAAIISERDILSISWAAFISASEITVWSVSSEVEDYSKLVSFWSLFSAAIDYVYANTAGTGT